MLLPALLLAAFSLAHANTEMLNFPFPLDSLPSNVNSQFQLSPVEITTNQLIASEFFFSNSSPQSSTQRVLHPLKVEYVPETTLGRFWSDLESKYRLERRVIRLCWPASAQSASIDMQLVQLEPTAQDVFLSISFTLSDNTIPIPGSASPSTQRSIPYTLLLEPTHLLVPESVLTVVVALGFTLLTLRLLSVPSRVYRGLRIVATGAHSQKVE